MSGWLAVNLHRLALGRRCSPAAAWGMFEQLRAVTAVSGGSGGACGRLGGLSDYV